MAGKKRQSKREYPDVDFDALSELYDYAFQDRGSSNVLDDSRTRINFYKNFLFDPVTARLLTVSKVGQYKKEAGEDPYVPERHQAVINDFADKARSIGAPERIIEEFYEPWIAATIALYTHFQWLMIDDDDFAAEVLEWFKFLRDGKKEANEKLLKPMRAEYAPTRRLPQKSA